LIAPDISQHFAPEAEVQLIDYRCLPDISLAAFIRSAPDISMAQTIEISKTTLV
jgi:hypothetical protein